MRRRAVLLLAAAATGLLTSASGCANGSSSDRGVYYGTGGTIHTDAFPQTFGGYYRIGRPGRYYRY
jgi:hypothetical protein